ncbi:Na+/H+ antiporter subunit E [Isoalcanivorax beigongshangi]|uniref:Na+/H+ antiporter subunit E n=1 Tax=Isoalcanivorax beigongshangi TaxID=3238810 RepID=A0ABV4ADE4_9GAMM
MIKRWLPFPLMSAFLLVMWLLLNDSFSVGQILLGALLAWGIPAATRRMQPVRARKVRRLGVALKLACVVTHDIVQSCIQVTGVIWGRREKRCRSGFMTLPLELRSPHGLAVLSCIISSTPGTAWVELSEDRRLLMIHVLDLDDEDAWATLIKTRYERPLMEIFE